MKNNQLIAGKSHLISLEEAIEMNALYRKRKDGILSPSTPSTVLPICETFNREDFDTLLAQDDCVGVRIYFGMHDNLDISAVIVGVNSNNEDIITPDPGDLSSGENIIIETGIRCPEDCPPKSELN